MNPVNKILKSDYFSNRKMSVGAKVEMEHKGAYLELNKYVKKHGKMPPQKVMAKLISKDHIAERPDYYKRLRKCQL